MYVKIISDVYKIISDRVSRLFKRKYNYLRRFLQILSILKMIAALSAMHLLHWQASRQPHLWKHYVLVGSIVSFLPDI